MDKQSISKAPGGWAARFSTPSLGADMVAGLTLWGMLVPEGLAYAGMADMPVQAGLYTLLVTLPLYFLLGGSPVLVCAATSSESIMLAAIVSPLAGPDPARRLALTALLVLLTGTLFLAAGFFRLGRASAFLSKPVMTGFVFGLAIYIAGSQLHKLLGLPRGRGDIFMQVLHLAQNIGHCNTATVTVGLSALVLLFLLERFAPRAPAGLIVMALGIGGSRYFDLGGAYGVDVVRAFQAGLPSLVAPHVSVADLRTLLPAAVGLALVAFSQALGTARSYAEKEGRQVDADRELKALGAANIGASLVGGLLAGGSMSSTAVNVAAGAKSQVSTLVTTVMIAITLLFMTPVFQGLPEAVLGAVVIHAVARLMKVGEMRRYLRLNPNEFRLALTALCGVPLFDILPGLALAVVASLLVLILYASNVTISVLGEIKRKSPLWVDIKQHPEAREMPGVRVLRLDRPLFFANAEKIRAKIMELLEVRPRPKAVALLLRANTRLCVTSTDMLRDLARELRSRSVMLGFVEPSQDMVRVLNEGGVLAVTGELIYPGVEQAVWSLRETLQQDGTDGGAACSPDDVGD